MYFVSLRLVKVQNTPSAKGVDARVLLLYRMLFSYWLPAKKLFVCLTSCRKINKIQILGSNFFIKLMSPKRRSFVKWRYVDCNAAATGAVALCFIKQSCRLHFIRTSSFSFRLVYHLNTVRGNVSAKEKNPNISLSKLLGSLAHGPA